MKSINTEILNTAILSIELVAQCEAKIVLDQLDAQYKENFGRKMSKKSRAKAFTEEFLEIFNFHLESALAD